MKTLLCLLLLALPLMAEPIILVANKQGQSFEAELLSATDVTVTVRRSSDKRIFRDVPVSTLSEATLAAVKRARETLAKTYPEYDIDVSIGAMKKGDEWYTEKQKVSATVKITNTHRTLDSPEVSCRFFFIGQGRDNKKRYQILATREFKVAPDPDKTVKVELRPYTGNEEDSWGWYDYDGYLLVLYKKDKMVAQHKTTNARYRKAIEMNVGILDRYRTIKAGTMVGENLLPSGERGNGKQDDVISIGE